MLTATPLRTSCSLSLQVIHGEEVVAQLSGVDMPIGFGSSLASSFDVDDNQVNGKDTLDGCLPTSPSHLDLAVGAFRSQQVFLFR